MSEKPPIERPLQFTYPPIRPYDEVWHTKSVDVSAKIQQTYSHLTGELARVKASSNQVKDSVSPHLGNLWHHLRLGSQRTRTGEQAYRGYAMVEPENMDQAILKLFQVAEQRLRQDKRTEFKWLVSCHAASSSEDRENLGIYHNLEIDSSRVVIYADKPEEILEIFQGLIDQDWAEIEKARIKAGGGDVVKVPRRSLNSHEFLDDRQRYWRSLNWNDASGHADDQQDQGQGRPMTAIQYPKPMRFNY